MIQVVVQTSHDECQKFRKRRIIDTLLQETDIKEAEGMKIARSVERQVKRVADQTITTSQIRELVNAQLLKRGDVDSARQHERVGIPVNEIKKIIKGHVTDNANIGRNPEAVHKFLADSGFKQYALMCLPGDLAQAHNKGDLHIHDLEYFAARPLNCLQSDLRWFIQNGTKVDGSGEHTSAAGPAKNVETLVNHAGQILMAAQVYMSGGQSLSLLNVFMAPFVKGLPYERVKQAVQMFVFNLNMSYVSRGGQAVFSSVNLEFTVPDFLKDEPAYGPGGKVVGIYGDYEDETRILNRAFIEVLTEGDSMGKFHLFPNTIWMLREEMMKSEFEEDLLAVHQLSSRFSTPYFGNCLPKWTGGHSDIMGSLAFDQKMPFVKEDSFCYREVSDIIEKEIDKNPKIEGVYEYAHPDDLYTYTYNYQSGKIEKKKVLTVIRKPPAPLIKIKTRYNKNIVVTPNHKMLVLKKGNLIEKKSEELEIGDELLSLNGHNLSFNSGINGNIAELVGFFVGDGYIRKEKGKQIEFHIKKKTNYIENLLKNESIDYESFSRKDGSYSIVTSDEFLYKLCEQCYDSYSEKIIPDKILGDINIHKSFLNGLISADGGIYKESAKIDRIFTKIYNSSKKVIDAVLYMLASLGIKASCSSGERKGWKREYQIYFNGKLDTHTSNWKIKILDIKYLKNENPVYDLEIEDNDNYIAGFGCLIVKNCRTRLNSNWTGDWDLDTLRTGNLAYITVNLPRIAYKVGDDGYYDELDRVLGLAEETLLLRRQQALKCLGSNNLLPFLSQTNKEGETYYRIENSTLSFGFVGMDETLKAMNIEDGIVSKDGQKVATNILKHMNEYSKDLTNETGYRWTILQTPGETTAHRFATLDMKQYPEKAIVKGEKGSFYYTNSSHIPVDENRYLIPEKIKIESQFHPLTAGGHIFHGFIGEAYPQPEAMMNLTKKIAKTDLGFWAYTGQYSYCFSCNTMMGGLQHSCKSCGSIEQIEHYSRITGYLQAVGNKKNPSGGWNPGKRQELKDRFNHKL